MNDSSVLYQCPYVKSIMLFIDYLENVYILNCVLNIVFAVIAVAGNSIVLYAIIKTPSLHKPSTYLLCNLAATDLAVGLLTQPLYAVYKITEMVGMVRPACYLGLLVNFFANLFSGMSFITVTCISGDRFLALYLHLRYATVVTSRRVIIIVVMLWVFNTFLVSFYPWNVSIAIYTGVIVVFTCLTISSLTFFKILRIVRRHQKQIYETRTDSTTSSAATRLQGLNLPKYLKSVVTIGYVHILMVLCYLPYMITLGSRLIVGLSKEYKLAVNITTTIIYINSAMNPLLYTYRLREFRAALLRVLGRRHAYNETFPNTFNSVSKLRYCKSNVEGQASVI